MPVDCVKQIVRIVRQRRLAEEKATFAHHAWVVQGYLQSKLLGNGSEALVGDELVGDEPLGTDDQMADMLELVARHDESVMAALPLPIALLVRWLLTKLLEQFVSSVGA
jgi:hypothetical protein